MDIQNNKNNEWYGKREIYDETKTLELAKDLKNNERVILVRDENGRITQIQKKVDSCWIVTAYFGGHPLDPRVCTIRAMIARWERVPVLGRVLARCHARYSVLGGSEFGEYWRRSVASSRYHLCTLISSFLCGVLLVLARALELKKPREGVVKV